MAKSLDQVHRMAGILIELRRAGAAIAPTPDETDAFLALSRQILDDDQPWLRLEVVGGRQYAAQVRNEFRQLLEA